MEFLFYDVKAEPVEVLAWYNEKMAGHWWEILNPKADIGLIGPDGDIAMACWTMGEEGYVLAVMTKDKQDDPENVVVSKFSYDTALHIVSLHIALHSRLVMDIIISYRSNVVARAR